MSDDAAEPTPKRCGLVMPISAIDGCSEQHWLEVKAILVEAIESLGFAAELVSVADDVGIIHKRIVQNLYENPIVVVDVSAKNPNVMFELGMRLTFDKPTIVIKDDQTNYSFDTSPIEHLEYPRDLRFSKIVSFQRTLAEKVKATYDKSQSDASFSTFLKHFGTFLVPKLETTEVPKDDFVLKSLRELSAQVAQLAGQISRSEDARDTDPLTYSNSPFAEAVESMVRRTFREKGMAVDTHTIRRICQRVLRQCGSRPSTTDELHTLIDKAVENYLVL